MRRGGLLLAVLAVMPSLAAQAPAPRMDQMLTELRAAATEDEAARLEGRLRTAWAMAASPAVRLLLSRGQRELHENATGDAVDSFDAALDLEPELLEAWRGRAAARLRAGDAAGASRDLQEVLKREPRSFLAWQDLSHVAEARGDWRGALAAWQKLLEVDPRSPGGQDRLQDLRRRAFGESL